MCFSAPSNIFLLSRGAEHQEVIYAEAIGKFNGQLMDLRTGMFIYEQIAVLSEFYIVGHSFSYPICADAGERGSMVHVSMQSMTIS
jgi:hypothetical protein